MLRTPAGELKKLKFLIAVVDDITIIHFYSQKANTGYKVQLELIPNREVDTKSSKFPLTSKYYSSMSIRDRLTFQKYIERKIGRTLDEYKYSKRHSNYIYVSKIKICGGFVDLRKFNSNLMTFFNAHTFRARYFDKPNSSYFLDYHLFIEYFINNAKVYGKRDIFLKHFHEAQSKLHGATDMVQS